MKAARPSLARRAVLAAPPWQSFVAALLALVVAAPSLAYPLARDQGLYFYVAREWLLRDALPYRDLFEQKTPGIYLVYAACIRLFGEAVWGIRLLELAAVAAIGLLASSVGGGRHARGAGLLGASILYYGFLGFWDTGQCEMWCALFVIASLFSIEGSPSAARLVSGGLCFGAALLMKPPILLFGAVLLWRMRARAAKTGQLVAFAALSAAPWAVALAYFAARAGMTDLVDVLVRANGYYATHESVGGLTDATTRIFDVLRLYLPMSFFLLYASFGLAWSRRKDATGREPYWLVVACTVTVFAVVAVQGKFYNYHFGILLIPATLAVVALAREAEARWAHGKSIALAHLVGLFVLSWAFEHEWFATARDLAAYGMGSGTRATAYAHFGDERAQFNTNDSESVAGWVRGRAEPGDTLCVRGFEPQIYALARLRCPSRFFWTAWLTDTTRAYRRADFLAQDRAALDREPPRFVVVKENAVIGAPDSEAYFAGHGYTRGEHIGTFVILVRPRPSR